MCLARVTGVPSNSTGFGWKVFRTILGGNGRPQRGNKEVYSENRGHRAYEYGKWYLALLPDVNDGMLSTGYRNLDGDLTPYKCGFHVALSRQDARNFINENRHYTNLVVRKVEYRGAHTSGEGAAYFPGKQVIASEIRVLPEVRPKRVKNAQATVTGVSRA